MATQEKVHFLDIDSILPGICHTPYPYLLFQC